MEIAVLVNENKTTSGFEKDGIILVYKKDNGEWKISRKMEYQTDDLTNSLALHQKIKEICIWLRECNIIIVNRIRGIHYIAFEEYQISMLEIKGIPEHFLEDIRECINHQRTTQMVPMEHNTIYERQPGKYDTDLRDVMNGKTSYNSKQILLPFIKNETFSVLEILCNHIPKWLEKEQNELNIRIVVENYKDCMKVKVYPL
jgi:Fe-only nitrogenase accessory protein AnfO